MSTLTETRVSGPFSAGPRTVWIQEASSEPADHCCLFLDGEFYIGRIATPEILQTLQAEGRIPLVTSVYLSHGDGAARHHDFACNATFAAFLVQELLPWIEAATHPHTHYVLCGLSLSGLQAAFTATQYPQRFAGALCQSPSAWWNEEWLTGYVQAQKRESTRFWISVGDKETAEDVTHPPTGLFQRTNQRDSCRRLAERLRANGDTVQFSEFAGGHDLTCWAHEVPDALCWLLDLQ